MDYENHQKNENFPDELSKQSLKDDKKVYILNLVYRGLIHARYVPGEIENMDAFTCHFSGKFI